jgi:hypothetical protein
MCIIQVPYDIKCAEIVLHMMLYTRIYAGTILEVGTRGEVLVNLERICSVRKGFPSYYDIFKVTVQISL